MERRGPDYEDEKIRAWRVRPGEGRPERDPSVLDIDLKREEIYESRVYEVTPEALKYIALDTLANNPGRDPSDVLKRLLESLDDATFRILAKQDHEDQLLTWVHVSRLGGTRTLIARVDRKPEADFRAFVPEFEASGIRSGTVYPPTVVTLDEWREHARHNQSDST